MPKDLVFRLIAYVLRGQAIDEVGRNIFAILDSQCVWMGDTSGMCCILPIVKNS